MQLFYVQLLFFNQAEVKIIVVFTPTPHRNGNEGNQKCYIVALCCFLLCSFFFASGDLMFRARCPFPPGSTGLIVLAGGEKDRALSRRDTNAFTTNPSEDPVKKDTQGHKVEN